MRWAAALVLSSIAWAGDEELFARHREAWLLTGQERTAEAIPLLEKIALEKRDYLAAYQTLGKAYAMAGRETEGEAFFRRVLAMGKGSVAHAGIARMRWFLRVDPTTQELWAACAREAPNRPMCARQAVDSIIDRRLVRRLDGPALCRKYGFPEESPACRAAKLSKLEDEHAQLGHPEIYTDAIREAEEAGDWSLVSILFNGAANAAFPTPNSRERVREFMDKSREAAAKAGDPEQSWNLDVEAREEAKAAGDRERHLRELEARVEKAEAMGHRLLTGHARLMLGEALGEYGQLEKALDEYLRSFEEVESFFGYRIAAHNRIAECLLQLGRLDEAMERYRSALSLAKQKGSLSEAGFLQNAMGSIEVERGDLTSGLRHKEEAMRAFRSIGMDWQAGAVEGGIGELYARMGAFETALRMLAQSKASAVRFKDKGEAMRLTMSSGDVLLRMGDVPGAMREYEKAWGMYGDVKYVPFRLEALTRLAEGSARMRRWDESEKWLALAEGEGSEATEARARIARLRGECALGRGDAAGARVAFSKAVELGDRVTARRGLAAAMERSGDAEGALAELRAAVETLEGTRRKTPSNDLRQSFLRENAQVYEDTIRLLAERGEAREALAMAEKARARVLVDLLGGARAQGQALLDAEGARRLAEGRESVLLEYALGEKRSWLWVVSGAGVRMAALPARARVEDAVRRARAAVEKPDAANAGALEAAHRMLLGPAAKELAGTRRVMVVADGILHYLPFEALVRADGRYVVETHEVSYSPSATAAARLQARATGPGEAVLAMGDPEYGGAMKGPAAIARSVYRSAGYEFGPLPNARNEVARIGQMFRGSKVVVGREATETAVKREDLRKYRRVHFAAHAVLDERVPERSGIVLAAGDPGGQDGVLRAGEASELKLDAEVAVLSACKTGLGRVVRGEGMVGLTRAFLSAGARNVVVTLWEVNDAASSGLMVDFYAAMRRGASPAGALREAKRKALREGVGQARHPHYWAGYVVAGG